MPTSSLGARWGRFALRGVLTAVLLAMVAALGQIPWGEAGEDAVLRIALRTVHGKVEVCRQLSVEERSSLPVHMRGTEVCDSLPVNYRLRVALAGRELVDELVEPGGFRRDRPHNFDREFSVGPGAEALEVLFEPQLPSEASATEVQAFDKVLAYQLRERVELRADRVTLVYLDDTSGRLEVMGG